MKKRISSILTLVLCLVLAAVMVVSCTPKTPETTTPEPGNNDGVTVPYYDYKKAEYNTTTSVMPSNWNELTYADNNDTQIMSYIGSSFFDYDYKFEDDKKFNDDGSINVDGVVVGAYTTNYSAATKLEDVTATVDAKWGYTAEQIAEGGYAWKITLRNDLKWDDGTAITAADFVYSMQAQLDPTFMNFRGNTYYDTLRVKKSREYFFQHQEGTYETVGSLGFESLDAAVAAGNTVWIDSQTMWGTNSSYIDENGNPCPKWLAYNDTTVYTGEYEGEPDPVSGNMLWTYYKGYLEVGASYASCAAIYVVNENRDVKWEEVGIYSIDSENAIVVCLDKSYALLKEDGTLSWQAPYYMASLPLVHRAKYEANKVAPTGDSELWTSTYNSDLASTASWGPYKLVEFEAGSHYKLVKNENWYGWNMNQYQNQYNVTAINCLKVAETNDKWMGFLAGIYDDASLDTHNIADYYTSKYVTYAPSTGTFGMQLFSDLSVLKASDNNNGILAIQEFRHAFNLSLNRNDIVEKIWPGTSVPCLGLVNSEYYYDIENSATLEDSGVYRFTTEAQEGLLIAYGFTKADDGTWSGAGMTGLSLEEATMSLTGYNPTLAKEKVKIAIEKLNADPEFYGYDSSKPITLVYGSSQDTAKQRDRATYLQNVLNELTKDTDLEGKIVIEFDASAGSGWADAFRSGDTQIGFGYGFSGNPFNPFSIIGAFVDPDDDLNYHQYWDTSAINMTLVMPEGDYDGAGEVITMSVQNWYFCLNGLAEVNKAPKTYNWDTGYAPSSVRLMILSALEQQALNANYSIMLIGDYSGSFLGAKFSYFSEDYNTFMGFGGIRYMNVEYTDAEWVEFVKANNGDLTNEYKKSE